MFFIELIRALPFLAIIGLGGYGYHWFVLNGLEKDVKNLNVQIEECNQQKAAIEIARQAQIETIDKLQTTLRDQKEAAEALAVYNSQLISERDSYLSIFRKHNLTQLALSRPGMIEPRINKGTREIFETLERESIPYETDTDSTTNSNKPNP